MGLHGIALYCMVLHGISLYCMVLHGIAWYCMLLVAMVVVVESWKSEVDRSVGRCLHMRVKRAAGLEVEETACTADSP